MLLIAAIAFGDVGTPPSQGRAGSRRAGLLSGQARIVHGRSRAIALGKKALFVRADGVRRRRRSQTHASSADFPFITRRPGDAAARLLDRRRGGSGGNFGGAFAVLRGPRRRSTTATARGCDLQRARSGPVA
jgi:hypothetical protein